MLLRAQGWKASTFSPLTNSYFEKGSGSHYDRVGRGGNSELFR